MFRKTLAMVSLVAVLSTACSKAPANEAPAPEAGPPPFRIVLVRPAGLAVPDLPGGGIVHEVEVSAGLVAADRAAVSELVAELDAAAVVVAPAPAGTAALFAALRQLKPGILLAAVEPAGDVLAIEAAADLVVELDAAMIAWGTVKAALELGAGTLVRVSAAGASGGAGADRFAAYGAAAAALLGVELLDIQATGAEGIPGALAGLAATAFAGRGRMAVTPVRGELSAALLGAAAAAGMVYVEGESPPLGYDGAAWNPEAYIGVAASLAASRGGSGKSVIRPWDRLEPVTAAVLEHVRRVAAGGAGMDDADALAEAFSSSWPVGAYRIEWRTDAGSGVRARNHFLVSGDAYLAGRGYLPAARDGFPPELRSVSAD